MKTLLDRVVACGILGLIVGAPCSAVGSAGIAGDMCGLGVVIGGLFGAVSGVIVAVSNRHAEASPERKTAVIAAITGAFLGPPSAYLLWMLAEMSLHQTRNP